MERILVTDLPAHVGERVRLAGWLYQLRRQGGISFLILRDRGGLGQVVVEDAAELDKLAGLQVETVLDIEGLVAAEPRTALGAELREPRITIVAPVVNVPPFEVNKPQLRAGLDTFLDHAPIGLRHPHKQAIFRIAAGLTAAFREHLTGEGFIEIQTPKVVGSATEGGANLFRIDYLGRPAFLAQSPQLYKQIMVGVFERVFEVGHVYRAEPHSTTRHLNEYVSLDVEMGFIADHTTLMATLTSLLQAMFRRVGDRNRRDLDLLGAKLPADVPVPAIRFREAQRLIASRYGEDCSAEDDLSPQHERWLCEWALAEHGSEFVYVTHFPTSKRPFYTMPDPDDLAHTLGFDLLFRGSELVTGGQRIHGYQQLLGSLRRAGFKPEDFDGYLEAFRYGMPPEGGFAIGLERLVARLLGIENVRETALFPRDMNRLAP